MRNVLIAFIVLTCLAPYCLAQSWRDGRAKVCFVRGEDNGVVNTLPSIVHVSDYDFPLSGGQAACIFALPGETILFTSSTVPGEPRSRNTMACKSREIKLVLMENSERTFLIDPATKGNGYSCGWQIKEVTPRSKKAK